NYIRLMGGEVKVKSELGKGTLFSFDINLPVADRPDSSQETRKVIGLEAGQPSYRILVVDDKWENRALLIKLLTTIGFKVRDASDGKEAVEIWAKWQPHLIWMDMRMPVMDGYSATKKIRNFELGFPFESDDQRLDISKWNMKIPHVLILALTASVFEHERTAVL